MKRNSALCVKNTDSDRTSAIVGIMLFSYNQNCIGCMAVHPDYRKQGIAAAMIEKMISLLPEDKDISVTTFRENDPWGTAPRALYRKFGFVEDELIFEFDYPHQRFVLRR